jgi:hypothetical protein
VGGPHVPVSTYTHCKAKPKIAAGQDRRDFELEEDERAGEGFAVCGTIIGEYLCEVQAKQYSKLDDLKSFENVWRIAFPIPDERPTT